MEIILKEAQRMMKVDVYSKVEFHKKKFKNILHWLSYKIGLHCCCYDLIMKTEKNDKHHSLKYMEVTINYFNS